MIFLVYPEKKFWEYLLKIVGFFDHLTHMESFYKNRNFWNNFYVDFLILTELLLKLQVIKKYLQFLEDIPTFFSVYWSLMG